jgi:hypothetical protein
MLARPRPRRRELTHRESPACPRAACSSPPSSSPPAPAPRPGSVQLPPTAREENSFTDPARSAILSTSYVFGPARLDSTATPRAGAEALARLEYLAVELDVGPRWIGMDPLVSPLMAQGRAEAAPPSASPLPRPAAGDGGALRHRRRAPRQ